MLLLGASVSMIYAGLDQGNRLDWLESGTVMALLIGGGVLFIGFLINETLVRQPWAHVNVLFSRNVGLALIVIFLYTLTSLSNSSLVPNFLRHRRSAAARTERVRCCWSMARCRCW